MYIFLKTLLLLTIISTTLTANTEVKLSDKNSYKVLCYHNVVDKITDPKIMNISTDQLIAHFKWLKVNGYTVISIDDILKAKAGTKDLPKKAVLLTFDDGYVSFYTRIYPLLKLYNYPGVYALVGKWQETPDDQNFLYGTLPRSRKMLLSWDEINEMKNSGLIEFASHTYDFHHGVIANPQGNTQPALTSLIYDPKTKRYESTKEYIKRVDEDIKKSSDTIYKHTGFRPRSIAWPYGAYNGIAQDIAKKYGMPITLTLDDGINTPQDIEGMKRILVENDPKFDNFYWSLQETESETQRSLFIDLDDIYDPDPKKTNINLGKVIEKVRKYMISTVILKAYTDSDSDGLADMLYFPNDTMPMKADLLNRIAWQIKGRAPIEDLYVQMPISAFELKDQKLSLHKSSDQAKIMKIYADMAKQSFFKGVMFDHTYNTPDVRTDDTIRFTKALLKSMRHFTINLKTALMINADHKGLEKFLPNYKYTFLNTEGLLSNSKTSKVILSNLIDSIKQYPNGLEKSAFVLSDKNFTDHQLADQMQALILNKALNIGYKPKDFMHSRPTQTELIKVFSLRSSAFE